MLVAAGLGALGLWLVYRGLLADRAKGRRRCPRCWYELQAASLPVRCSECGREATSERELFRTHRRWGVALAGVVLIAVSPWTRRIPEAVKHGPARLVPTCALLQLCGDEQVKQWTEETLLFGPKATSPFARELVRRGVEEAIPAWQSEVFERRVRRYLVDKGEAVMPSGEEEILRRLGAAKLPSDRAMAEMEELFAEVGKALGTRVEVDWESMWAGRVLKTDKVGLDTRGLPARVALDRVMAARPTPAWLKWSAVGGGLKCEYGKGEMPWGVRGFDVAALLDPVIARDRQQSETERRSRGEYFQRVNPAPMRFGATRTPKIRGEFLNSLERIMVASVNPEEWIENGGVSARHAWLGDRVMVVGTCPLLMRVKELLRAMETPCRDLESALRRTGTNPIVYDIADFMHANPVDRSDAETSSELEAVITQNIETESWVENGGDGGWAKSFGTLLIISQSERHQIAVAKLLDDLRKGRAKVPELAPLERK